jgi:7-cyano-7-deazaguanine synthase
MDSSLCLALAIEEFGSANVHSLSFHYEQRHAYEVECAKRISAEWNVSHRTIDLTALQKLTHNALMDPSIPIEHPSDGPPNTLVMGRNGLMAHLAGIFAEHVGARCLYMGVMALEAANSGYRDCSREYMDLVQSTLRMDLGDPGFEIRTPLVNMLKKETMALGYRMGILEFLLRETVTCYEGVSLKGCQTCPACLLRNEGLAAFCKENPSFVPPFNIV